VIEIQLKKFRDRLLLKMFIRQQAALNCELMEYSVVEATRREVCTPQKAVKQASAVRQSSFLGSQGLLRKKFLMNGQWASGVSSKKRK
jgi:hypothetical protein